MELRRATADEWQAARAVRLQALTQDSHAFCDTLERAIADEEESWRERLARGITFLAWEGEIAFATVTGKKDPHETGGWEIVALWVNPAQRRTGLADALITSVIDWARKDGAHEVALWVAEDNVPARSLYERAGFTPTGEREAMRQGVDQIRMRQELV